MHQIKLGSVAIDRNFYHMSEIKSFVDFVNDSMVTNIETVSEQINEEYRRTKIYVSTQHMGEGAKLNLFTVRLAKHNNELLHEYIADYLSEEPQPKQKEKSECPNCHQLDIIAQSRVEGLALIPINEDKPKHPTMVDWQSIGSIQFYECRDCGHRWDN